jgi:hypothetical protein
MQSICGLSFVDCCYYVMLQARRSHDAAAAGSRSPGKKLLGMLHLRKATERALMHMPASMRRINVQVRA